MNKISLDDLIKIANSKADEKVDRRKFINDVHRFISVLNIKEGKHKVKSRLLFRAYRAWSIRPIKEGSFYYILAELFHQRHTMYRYYLINYKPIELLNKIDNEKVKIK